MQDDAGWEKLGVKEFQEFHLQKYISEGVRIYFYKIYVLCHLTLQLLSYLSKIPTVRLIV
ncbi:hypothetical protein RYX36_036732, partial [Vicia faba]